MKEKYEWTSKLFRGFCFVELNWWSMIFCRKTKHWLVLHKTKSWLLASILHADYVLSLHVRGKMEIQIIQDIFSRVEWIIFCFICKPVFVMFRFIDVFERSVVFLITLLHRISSVVRMHFITSTLKQLRSHDDAMQLHSLSGKRGTFWYGLVSKCVIDDCAQFCWAGSEAIWVAFNFETNCSIQSEVVLKSLKVTKELVSYKRTPARLEIFSCCLAFY